MTIKGGVLSSQGEIRDTELFEIVEKAQKEQIAVKEIDFSDVFRITDAGLLMLTCFRESLHSLYLKNVRTQRTHPYYDYTRASGSPRNLSAVFFKILSECSNLTKLKLSDTDENLISNKCLEVIGQYGRQLTELSLSGRSLAPRGLSGRSLALRGRSNDDNSGFDEKGIEHLYQLKGLTKLEITRFPKVPFKKIVDLAANSPQLQTLGIQGGKETTDEDIKYLSEKIQNVSTLHLYGPSSLTENSLVQLSTSQLTSTLTFLGIADLNTKNPTDWKICGAFEKLRTLILLSCNPNLPSIQYLCKKIHSLNQIYLFECEQLDGKEVEKLRNEFPNKRITIIEKKQEQSFFSGWF